MRLTWLIRALAILFVTSAICSISNAQAPENRHVVTVTELSKDASAPAEARQANETAIRHLMSSEPGQKALGSAKIDYAKVDKAVAQLSDEDVARLATRSREVEHDFAAGSLSDRDLLVIVIIAVLVIALVAALH